MPFLVEGFNLFRYLERQYVNNFMIHIIQNLCNWLLTILLFFHLCLGGGGGELGLKPNPVVSPLPYLSIQ